MGPSCLPPATRPVPLSPSRRVGRTCSTPSPGRALSCGPGGQGSDKRCFGGRALPLSPAPGRPSAGARAGSPSPRTWEIGDPLPVQLVGDADLDLVQGVQDVQLGQGQPVGTGDSVGGCGPRAHGCPPPPRSPPQGAASSGAAPRAGGHTQRPGGTVPSCPHLPCLGSQPRARAQAHAPALRPLGCHADPALHPHATAAPASWIFPLQALTLTHTRCSPSFLPSARQQPHRPDRTPHLHPLWPHRAEGLGGGTPTGEGWP